MKRKIKRHKVRGVNMSKGAFVACSGSKVSGGAKVPRGLDAARRKPPPWLPALLRFPCR